MADRLGGLRPGDSGAAGLARARIDRWLHPHRHDPRRPAAARAPRSRRAVDRLAAPVSATSASAPAAYLVDASMYVFRAWHSLPPDLLDADGCPVNAVHGFTRFLLELLERRQPQHIVVAFDAALASSFRNDLYPPYKANREPAPDELKRQFAHCAALSEALGLRVLVHNRYEADDLIGSALQRLRAHGLRGVIVSADKDLSQLLCGDDEQWDYARDQRWNAAGVKARYGVHAHQIADYLGLCGDAVDNIPGVPGIGAKTAATLLGHFGSLDDLLARHAEIPYLRLRGAAMHARRLHEHRALALLCRQLATIAVDAPLPEDFSDARRGAQDASALGALLDRLRIGPMTRRRIAAVAI
ncbi:MAG: exodeoxyribonuclease IX [Proteobacteria bacterium]|nr:exodeoxyribonuclease IX [Pseudomonadota bacterium]